VRDYVLGFETKVIRLELEGVADLTIRSLLDRNQFFDPAHIAEAAGVSPTMWPIFGVVWSSGRILAEHVANLDLCDRRVLELGSGLALASLVLHRRGADITASDIHPLAERFLSANTTLNGLVPIPFHTGSWSDDAPALGSFDLLIGSDVLYDPGHAPALSAFIGDHAGDNADVIIVDPNRGHRSVFRRLMAERGFQVSVTRAPTRVFDGAAAFRGQILAFRRRARVGLDVAG
jgi:predicted nicotinamide N-methyase